MGISSQMAAMVSLIVAILLAITLLPWSFWLLVHAWTAAPGIFPPVDTWWVIAGVVCSVPLVVWQRPNAFIHTTVHECCHALLCLCLGVRVTSFMVSDGQGGAVGHERVDPLRSTIISIAPYTLPLLVVPLLIIRQWVITDPGWPRGLLSGMIAFFYVHHLHALYYNVRLNFWGRQADLVKVGRPLSAVLIASALFLFTWWVLMVLWG
ncbi:MAG: hypothetical protein EA401_01555 [Planctomycetota bacterium]|nr:MAG: hypothetical protein EA401_01555 [Planctomycetota bacterium]